MVVYKRTLAHLCSWWKFQYNKASDDSEVMIMALVTVHFIDTIRQLYPVHVQLCSLVALLAFWYNVLMCKSLFQSCKAYRILKVKGYADGSSPAVVQVFQLSYENDACNPLSGKLFNVTCHMSHVTWLKRINQFELKPACRLCCWTALNCCLVYAFSQLTWNRTTFHANDMK